MRDPYAIYAKRILGLTALDAIGATPGPAERGTAVHDALYKFQKAGDLDPAILLKLLEAELIGAGFSSERRTAYLARVEGTATAFAEWARERNEAKFAPLYEIGGSLDLGGARLSCRADRIDRRPDGRAEIIDYKTGQPPSNDMVSSGFAPQLLLEAAILEEGGFKDAKPTTVEALIYWRFGARSPFERPVKAEGAVHEAAREALAELKALLAKYDAPAQPFLSRPRVQFLDDYGDYDHLARRHEWADLGGGE